MKKKYYYLSRNGNLLLRTGIIEGCHSLFGRGGSMTINVERLTEATDNELIRYRGIGRKSVAQINEARKALIELLLTNK